MIHPQEIALHLAILGHKDPSAMLRYLAACVFHSKTSSGANLLDASDFKHWLEELAEEMEKHQKAGVSS